MRPRLILVGGFLGAGKTTMLWQAAAELVRQGKRVGLITNDQAPQLVDTGFLKEHGFEVSEIAGGCFCCRFNELVRSAQGLVDSQNPDVLIGEPVGSCTDLSATVLQPIKEQFAEAFDIAPFSVMIDPHRLLDAIGPDTQSLLHSSARYILQKQLEEADRIVLNKTDTLAPGELEPLLKLLAERYPRTPVHCVSALRSKGIAEWLQAILAPGQVSGQRIVDVDYDTYAEGEAVLGWLNATVNVSREQALDWREYSLDLVKSLQSEMKKRSAEIAHLKILLSTPVGFYACNVTSLIGEPAIQGGIDGSPRGAHLVINARVEMAPDELKSIVGECLRVASAGKVSLANLEIESLSPGRPTPVHRYAKVV